MKNKKGFTLTELLIVVSIIGVIASLAIPNLLSATHKTKQKATMADMKSVGTAVEMYITDHHVAPADLSFGDSNLKNFYVRNMPGSDNWGNKWEYQSDKDIYYIGSPARDGIFLGFEQAGSYKVNSDEDLNNDIIFSNGSFIFAPGTVAEGGQVQGEDSGNTDEQAEDEPAENEKDKKPKKEKKPKKPKKTKKPKKKKGKG